MTKPLTAEEREKFRERGRKGGIAKAAKLREQRAASTPYAGTFLAFLDAVDRSGTSRAGWRALWTAADALPPTEEELAAYRLHTGRTTWPTTPAVELWVIAGRRSGKSENMVQRATWRAISFDRAGLAPGEMLTVPLIASDRAQARNTLNYLRGLAAHPLVRPYVVTGKVLRESVEFTTGVVVQVHTASYRATRGFTMGDVILEEVAFFSSEDSANPDEEILAAVRPALATVPGARVYGISSPYARRGVLWQAYEQHFGRDGDDVLVWCADTKSMNPTVPERIIARAFEEDAARAGAEYGHSGLVAFRADVESFLGPESLAAVIPPGRRELSPRDDVSYVAFTDPSGGSADSFTLAVAHNEQDRVVLDCVREVRPPFSPDAVVQEFAALLKTYRVDRVRGDHYAGEWPRERFAAHGVLYQPEERPKSELYGALLPVVNAGRCELLDIPRLRTQLLGLERRTARGGRDSIDHAPGAHDDVANCVAGAIAVAGAGTLPAFAQWAKRESERLKSPEPEPQKKIAPPKPVGVVSVETRRFGPTASDVAATRPSACPECGSKLLRAPMGVGSPWSCASCTWIEPLKPKTVLTPEEQRHVRDVLNGGVMDSPLAGLIAAAAKR